jgi:ankyrin repeat protein
MDPHQWVDSIFVSLLQKQDWKTLHSKIKKTTAKSSKLNHFLFSLINYCVCNESFVPLEVFHLVLAKKVDVNQVYPGTLGTTPLMALMYGTEFVVVKLLLEHGADVNLQNDDGMTALMILSSASGSRSLSILDLVLKYKPQMTVGDKLNNRTALHYACCFADAQFVNRLIQAGAGINVKDKLGFTPFDAACRYLNVDVVKLLLDFKASTACSNRLIEC